jgi:hypothetical protein
MDAVDKSYNHRLVTRRISPRLYRRRGRTGSEVTTRSQLTFAKALLDIPCVHFFTHEPL